MLSNQLSKCCLCCFCCFCCKAKQAVLPFTFCFPLSYIYQNTAFTCDDRSRSLYFSNSCRISAAEKFEHHIYPYNTFTLTTDTNKHSQHTHTYIIRTGIISKKVRYKRLSNTFYSIICAVNKAGLRFAYFFLFIVIQWCFIITFICDFIKLCYNVTLSKYDMLSNMIYAYI